VGLTLDHISFILLAAVIAYAIREIRRYRQRTRPRRPDISMEETWTIFRQGDPRNADLALLPSGASVPEPQESVLEQLRRRLLDLERAWADQWDQRRAVRAAILSSTVIALHLEALGKCDESARRALIKGYQAEMDRQLREATDAATIEWLVLRCYARWKFDDAVPDDWFHNYVRIARPYIREKIRLAQQHVLQVDEDARRFTEVYDKLLAELGEKLLPAPPKKRFVPPDLPSE